MITTRELSLSDVAEVRKINRVGTISALELIRREDGKSFVFCSFLYRENAFQCMYDAWLTVMTDPPPRRMGARRGRGVVGEEEALEKEEGIELEDMTGWNARRERTEREKKTSAAADAAEDGARSLTASMSYGRSDGEGSSDGDGHSRGSSAGSASGSGGSRSSRGSDGKLKRSNSAPLTLLHAPMDAHADAITVLRRELPYHTPPHVFFTLYDVKGSLLAAHLTNSSNATDLTMSPKAPFGRGGGNEISERFISYRTPTLYTFPNMPKFCTVGLFRFEST